METPIQPASVGSVEEPIDFFDFAPEMLAIVSIDGHLLRVNAASKSTIGRARETLVGTPFLDLVLPDDLEIAARKLAQASQTDTKVSFRSRCAGHDGRVRWIQWELGRGPGSRAICAIARDVTDHCTAERELARANEILSTIFLKAPLPIWASDPDGRIQFWNESAEKVLGWSSGEIFSGQAPDTLPACGGPGAKTALTGEKVPWRRKDGSTKQLRFWTAPLHENGVQCGTLGMTVDVTEYDAEVYEALQRAYTELRDTREAVMEHERLRVLGQMASGIAHDINNALSPVKLYIQMLIEDEQRLTEAGRENLRTIKSAVEDITETVSRIREFYRLREPQLTLTPVNLNEIVHQVVELTRPRWRDIPQELGIIIEPVTELARELPPVLGIESEIREALTNLIFNAVDAMPAGGTITLRTGVAEANATTNGRWEVRHAYLDVSDTGVGMDEDTRRRCLEPFFTTKGDRGTGLGLAMVYGVMQRSNGAVDLQSTLGKGTTVALRFVLAQSAHVLPAHSAVPAATRSPMRILVIDDDALVAQALRATLERDGHQVTTANGGEVGLDTFRSARSRGQDFNLVMTDLGMPHVDGRKVASAVKAESPATPVVLLTGWGRRIVAENDVPPHVDCVLSKPPDLKALRDVVAKCSVESCGENALAKTVRCLEHRS